MAGRPRREFDGGRGRGEDELKVLYDGPLIYLAVTRDALEDKVVTVTEHACG